MSRGRRSSFYPYRFGIRGLRFPGVNRMTNPEYDEIHKATAEKRRQRIRERNLKAPY